MAFIKHGVSTSLGPVEVKTGEEKSQEEKKAAPQPAPTTTNPGK